MRFNYTQPIQIIYPVRAPIPLGAWALFLSAAGASGYRLLRFLAVCAGTASVSKAFISTEKNAPAGLSKWLWTLGRGNIREGPD